MTALPSASDFTGSTRTEGQVKAALTDLRGFLADLFGTDGTAQTAQATLGALAAQTVDVTASTTVTAADRGRILRVTATATLTLPALSAVPAGWTVIIRCSAGGTATVNAAGSDLITGAGSVTLRPSTWLVISAMASQWVTWGAGGAVDAAPGTAALPGVFFSGDPDSGMYWVGANQIGWATGGVQRLLLSTTALTATLPVLAPAGSAAAPAFSFSGDVNTGMLSPGADQIGWATGGTQRLLLSTTALTPTVPVLASSGSATAPSLSFSGDTNTGMFSLGADVIGFATNGFERMRVGNNGLQIGDPVGTGVFGLLRVAGPSSGGAATVHVSAYGADASGPALRLGKSRTAALGGVDIVQPNDVLGSINFLGADGSTINNLGADIVSVVTGTPATADIRSNIRLRTRGDTGVQDRLAVNDVQVAVTGRLTVNSAVANAVQVTVADDAVTTFTPARTGGYLLMTAGGNVGGAITSEPHSATVFFDVGSTAAFCARNTGTAGLGAQVDCVTGTTLTGTTGTDGNVTVSARTDGTLMLENRSGSSRTFTLWVL